MNQKDFEEQVALSEEIVAEVIAEELEIAKLTKKFLRAQTEQEEAEKRLMEIFGATVDAYIRAGDFKGGKALILREMVDCVSRIFLLDRIRQAELKVAQP